MNYDTKIKWLIDGLTRLPVIKIMTLQADKPNSKKKNMCKITKIKRTKAIFYKYSFNSIAYYFTLLVSYCTRLLKQWKNVKYICKHQLPKEIIISM